MKTKQLIITILMITFVTMITTKVETTETNETQTTDDNQSSQNNSNDTKSVTINLKENENSYTLHFNNNPKIGDASYEFSTSEFDACGTPHWSDTGSLDKKDLLDRIITPWTKNGNSKTSARALSSAFKKELGL